MAFPIGQKDVGVALGQAVEDRRARQEVPVAFGYNAGSPGRFAGDLFLKSMGTNGEFGSRTNDKEDKEMQQAMLRFTKQWTSGPFPPETIGSTSEVA